MAVTCKLWKRTLHGVITGPSEDRHPSEPILRDATPSLVQPWADRCGDTKTQIRDRATAVYAELRVPASLSLIWLQFSAIRPGTPFTRWPLVDVLDQPQLPKARFPSPDCRGFHLLPFLFHRALRLGATMLTTCHHDPMLSEHDGSAMSHFRNPCHDRPR